MTKKGLDKRFNNKRIEGNLKQLPQLKRRGGRNMSNALRSWTIGDVGEVIGFWALHKARFWRIVKPLLLQHKSEDKLVNISSFISPNQLRQGLCWLPNSDERYYRKILTEEQIQLTFRWDFLALKYKVGPCLVEIKTQSGTEPSDDYRLFKKRDFSKEKKMGFQIFCLRVVLRENWEFEVVIEEL
ncbi:MAG: hypothetical protein NWE95_05015 [Candidatus Bathyarchaeota archaeon]|nr:hypothetical protein [Candidatus Bathyarchaeota archaeon]